MNSKYRPEGDRDVTPIDPFEIGQMLGEIHSDVRTIKDALPELRRRSECAAEHSAFKVNPSNGDRHGIAKLVGWVFLNWKSIAAILGFVGLYVNQYVGSVHADKALAALRQEQELTERLNAVDRNVAKHKEPMYPQPTYPQIEDR